MTKPIKKAVLTVGGLGTRFLPATKAIPKEMMPVVDKPLIQYAVEEALAAGIEEFIFVTGRGKQAIEDHFDYSYELVTMLEKRGKQALVANLAAEPALNLAPGQISYTRQQEPLGLGHAVWCARHLVGDEPFALLLADDLILSETPCLGQMMAAYAKIKTPPHMTAVMEVKGKDISRYGVLDVAKIEGDLVMAKGLVEKPAPEKAPSPWAIIGRYILQPSIFKILENLSAGQNGEKQLTDALADEISSSGVAGFAFEGQRYDCGDKAGFLLAQIAFGLARDDLADDLRRGIAALHLGEEEKKYG